MDILRTFLLVLVASAGSVLITWKLARAHRDNEWLLALGLRKSFPDPIHSVVRWFSEVNVEVILQWLCRFRAIDYGKTVDKLCESRMRRGG